MSSGSGPTDLRVGQGFDIHRFSDDPARPLVLGGVVVEHSPGLAGHSDADVVTHCLADALLGAAALGDLGAMFPASDERWSGANSFDILRGVLEALSLNGVVPVNADCTIVCDSPRLADHTAEMGSRLSGAVGAPVSVKAKRAESLGALGRAEGIACFAVALVAVPPPS